jgi:hypothetical protein
MELTKDPRPSALLTPRHSTAFSPYERLLADIVHSLRRAQAGAQLYQQELTKIVDKVLLGGEVPASKPLKIGFIEREEFHIPLKWRGSITP